VSTAHLAEDLTHPRETPITVLHQRRSAVWCLLTPRLPGADATTDIAP
jgi:hypothetical protein